MKAKIIIQNMRVSCILGLGALERKNPQEIKITLQLFIDAQKASKTDNIEDTVNYSELYKKVVSFVSSSQFHLLEALGGGIAEVCLQTPGVQKVIITTIKFNRLKNADSVAVEIEQGYE